MTLAFAQMGCTNAQPSAFRMTGPFVAMIRFMLVRDLKQFSTIYLVFLHAFAQCFFFVTLGAGRQEATLAEDPELGLGSNGTAGWEHSAGHSRGHLEAEPWRLLASLFVQYAKLCMELFKMTLGVYDLEPFRHSTLARLFFLLFMYLVPILFNM